MRLQPDPRAPTDPGEPRVEPAAALDVVTLAAALLFVNGQTTRRMIDAVTRLASALGFTAAVFPRWGELTLRLESRNAQSSTTIAADPASVDMHKVAAAMSVIDDVCAGRMGLEAARSALKAIGDMPPVSAARFASMTAAGAMALGVIFSAMHVPTLVLIGLSAGAGRACGDGLRDGPPIPSFSPSAPPCWPASSARSPCASNSARCSGWLRCAPAWCWCRARMC